ncbi:hypothetical protein Mapa_015074 [Marchantia paleacea]|nr:hypothetical protein Mapa_015074 [Marchantia paleacea]
MILEVPTSLLPPIAAGTGDAERDPEVCFESVPFVLLRKMRYAAPAVARTKAAAAAALGEVFIPRENPGGGRSNVDGATVAVFPSGGDDDSAASNSSVHVFLFHSGPSVPLP